MTLLSIIRYDDTIGYDDDITEHKHVGYDDITWTFAK